MSIENILNNEEYKKMFLKAILLGITYGKSNNADYYKESIEKELKKTVNTQSISQSNNNCTSLYAEPNKYEQNIEMLEKQKQNIINMIKSLSSNNYSYNYSKINILKNNLVIIQQEIEKNKIFIIKEQKKQIPVQKSNNLLHPVQVNQVNQVNNLNRNIKPVQTNKEFKKTNLSSELEKTLGSLSNLLIN
jgi:hypothetical protein